MYHSLVSPHTQELRISFVLLTYTVECYEILNLRFALEHRYTHLEVDDILGITAFIQPSSVDVFAALDTEYRGYINSGIKISDLFGKTTFIRPSSLDIHAMLRPNISSMVYSGLHVNDVEGKIFFFVPSSDPVPSNVPRWATGVEAMIDSSAGWYSVLSRRFELPNSIQNPFDPLIDWAIGPASWNQKYSTPKRFHHVSRVNTGVGSQDGVVFQDEVSKKIYVSWLLHECDDVETFELDTDGASNSMLYGATSDGNDRLFYFVVDDSNVDGDLPYVVFEL